MIDNIYVVATNWSGVSKLNLEHFYTPHKALKKIIEIAIEHGFTKPDPEDDPEQYLDDYDDYLIENNICPKINISLHIINLGEELSMDRNYYQQNYKSI
tara:strand:+ start:524 stop:820 length:297 start_codon:yes stop_codon:yes gene_type:complete